MPVTVINLKRKPWPADLVRIDRATVWGNPFAVVGTKSKYPVTYLPTLAEVLAAYEAHIRSRPDLMAQLHILKGKRLGCWCAPGACHGDVLARLVAEVCDGAQDGGGAAYP